MKKIFTLIILVIMSSAMSGCQKEKVQENTSEDASEKTIKIGTFSASKSEASSGKEALEKMGYNVEMVIFDDAVLPNTALAEGSIDANLFQHTPYLEAYLKDNNKVSLSMLKPLLYYPNYGIYSSKHENIEDIPEGGTVGIYNDASNMDRGLRLLDHYGLIKLIDEEKELYNKLDIVENTKNLDLVEIAFGNAIRSLEDTDATVAASSHILEAGIDPESALALEEVNNNFSCGFTVRTEDMKANPKWMQDMIKAYTSDEARKKIKEDHKGALSPLY